MRDVRKVLMQKNVYNCANGCAAHCLKSSSIIIGKFEIVSRMTKDLLLVSSKTVKPKRMVKWIFAIPCKEKLGKVYSMVLHSSWRWRYVNTMFQWHKKVHPVLTLFNYTVLDERPEQIIDAVFQRALKRVEIHLDQSFWRNLDSNVGTLEPICKGLGFMESSNCSMADLYAALLFVCLQVLQNSNTNVVDNQKMDENVLWRND